MANRLLALAAALSAAIVSPAMAADPPLAPSAPWTLEYDTDSCALRRLFGAGEDRAYLEFRRFGPGSILQTIIASSRMKPTWPLAFRYRWGGEGEWRDVAYANSVTLDTGFDGVLFEAGLGDSPEHPEIEDPRERAAYFQTIDSRAIEEEAAARAEAISLRGAFRKELSLHLGSLAEPIAALNKCVDELTTHWGIDVEAHKTLTRPAVPANLPEVGSMIDYPPKMIRRRTQGVVNIRLAVNETGRITGCRIQMPLSDPVFEETSCVDVQHALDFYPALDKDGRPIASYWVTRVLFQLR